MNKLIHSLAGALMLSITLPVLAGPDFQLIEQARKAKQAAQLARMGETAAPVAADRKDCPPSPVVLPLDHGPRAQTTPQQNQMRKARFEAQMKACKDAAK